MKKLKEICFFVHSGYVFSAYDNDRHYVDARRLILLYGIGAFQCIEVFNDRVLLGYKEKPGDVHLYPRSGGDYREHLLCVLKNLYANGKISTTGKIELRDELFKMEETL